MNYHPSHDEIYGCIDCGKIEHYMINDDVWLKAVPNYITLKEERRRFGLFTSVCKECVEVRLERSLTIEDFKNVPINDNILFGYRLAVKDLWKKDSSQKIHSSRH